MDRPGRRTLHRATALVAVWASTVVLAAGLVLYSATSVVQVGTPAAVVLTGAALSQPLWAGALAAGLSEGADSVGDPWRSRLLAASVVALAGLLGGFALVVVDPAGLRPVGDVVYAVATALVLAVAAGVLVAGQ